MELLDENKHENEEKGKILYLKIEDVHLLD
jgi:hypothetical protein